MGHKFLQDIGIENTNKTINIMLNQCSKYLYNLLNFWTDGPDASNASSKKLFVESETLNKLEL